jgi:hypothetical protein
VHGIELTAESLGGRRNRVDTILARLVPAAAQADAVDAPSVRETEHA